jgi:hypothetical protein
VDKLPKKTPVCLFEKKKMRKEESAEKLYEDVLFAKEYGLGFSEMPRFRWRHFLCLGYFLPVTAFTSAFLSFTVFSEVE